MQLRKLAFLLFIFVSSLFAEGNIERFPSPSRRQMLAAYSKISFHLLFEANDLRGSCNSFRKYLKKGAEDQFNVHQLNPVEITEEQAQMPAIILLHGAMSNQGLWVPLASAIEKDEKGSGPVYSFNFKQENGLDCLIKKIEKIREQYLEKGASHLNLYLVGHSLGAIVSADYAFNPKKWVEGTSVRKVISIAGRLKNLDTPSETSFYPFCYDVLPLIDDIFSRICRDEKGVKLFTIASQDDWLVPIESVLITKNKEREAVISGRGHLGIIFHKGAIEQVIEWITQES